MSDEPSREPPANEHDRPKGVYEHWCEHPGCTKWGTFGVPVHGEPRWFCGEHIPEQRK